MNRKKNKEEIKLTGLINKLSAAVFNLGVRYINTPMEKMFLRNMCKIDPSLYIIPSHLNVNGAFGFKTFYCGVNTFIPPEFKNFWISDHHFLSVFLRIGSQQFSIIPYNNELYSVKLRRISLPSNCGMDSIRNFFSGCQLIDGIIDWIELFYLNNDDISLYEQGITYPEFEKFNDDAISSMVRLYKLMTGTRRINDARKKINTMLEKMLSSIL